MNLLQRIKNKMNREAVQKKDCVEYYIDLLELEKNCITLRGWIFSKTNAVKSVNLVFCTQGEEKKIPLVMTKRIDVANSYDLKDIYCGFRVQADYESDRDFYVYLEYQQQNHARRIFLCEGEKNSENKGFFISEKYMLTYQESQKEFWVDTPVISERAYQIMPDIIVPIYNGFEYLEKLFLSMEKTNMKYRLFLVEDKSSDERIIPFLQNYIRGKENVKLIRNEENLGFVQSVNKALRETMQHVVLVNTDVVLPDQWLERLMTPLLEDEHVASATPFTNSGTICSFPQFCENNPLFLNLGVNEIDQAFSHIRPRYEKMPTGVGFCMAMSRKAIEEVGLLDEETFYKGYGEENDWCQRAIKKGYCHVQVENLFVWHKHGGSFTSEDKQKYIDRNLKILGDRYPHYHADVAKYCAKDPNGQLREFVKLKLMLQATREYVVVFSHNWGGGANTYLNDRIEKMTAAGLGVVQIIDDTEFGLYGKVRLEDQHTRFYVKGYEELYQVIAKLRCSQILINELVSFEKIKDAQEFILRLKKQYEARVTMLFHDYYAVCPSIYLLDNNKCHCFFPEIEKCRECYQKNGEKLNKEYETVDQWRTIWSRFLSQCDELITFSENTKKYYQYYYPDLNYQVIPHQVDYIAPVKEYTKTNDMITIGVIGNLMQSKGSEIVYRMQELIKEKRENARIVVIGPDMDGNRGKDLIIHGKYRREELPDLMEKYQVDVIFIASIWPETFSYTTEEAIKMGMPVASFDIGAPAERLKKYEKGIIIPKITAEDALQTILDQVTQQIERTRGEECKRS